MSEYILCKCKSEKPPRKGTRQRRNYRVSIKYAKNGAISINEIIKTSTCTCPSKRICKHILGTLLHARDFDDKILKKIEQNIVLDDSAPIIKPIKRKRRKRAEQVKGIFEDPKTRKKRCIVRIQDERFDSNIKLRNVDSYKNKKALKFHEELIWSARTFCAQKKILQLI